MTNRPFIPFMHPAFALIWNRDGFIHKLQIRSANPNDQWLPKLDLINRMEQGECKEIGMLQFHAGLGKTSLYGMRPIRFNMFNGLKWSYEHDEPFKAFPLNPPEIRV